MFSSSCPSSTSTICSSGFSLSISDSCGWQGYHCSIPGGKQFNTATHTSHTRTRSSDTQWPPVVRSCKKMQEVLKGWMIKPVNKPTLSHTHSPLSSSEAQSGVTSFLIVKSTSTCSLHSQVKLTVLHAFLIQPFYQQSSCGHAFKKPWWTWMFSLMVLRTDEHPNCCNQPSCNQSLFCSCVFGFLKVFIFMLWDKVCPEKEIREASNV